MSIDHELERIGRIVAADQGLDVHMRGDRAYAVPGQVVLPNLDQLDWLPIRNARRMMHGLLDHECGHAVATDFSAIAAWRKTRNPCQALDSLWNLLEDGYVERIQGRRYLGTVTNVTLMNQWYWEHGDGKASAEEQIKEHADLITAFLIAVGSYVRDHGHHDISYFEALNPEVASMLRLCQPELDEARSFVTLHATKRNQELAEAIFAKVSKPPPPQPPGSSKLGETPVEGGKPAAGPAAPGTAEAGEEPEVRVIDLERWTKPGPLSATEALDTIVRSVFEQPAQLGRYTIFTQEYDAERDFTADDLSQLSQAFEAAKARAREAADALVFAFEAALRASSFVVPTGGHDEGEVDPQLLTEFAIGSLPADQLYLQREIGDAEDTAVFVLCDCSGSMGGQKSIVCQESAIAMHMALQSCQVPHEIGGFTTLELDNVYQHSWANGRVPEFEKRMLAMGLAIREAKARGTNVDSFTRGVMGQGGSVPFHAIFKNWGGTDARALMHIRGIANNLDGESVLWAARRLAARSERRRVLFVLSDGYPAGSRDNALGRKHLKETVSRVIASGIECYGIGIQSAAVAEFYPLWWKADSLSDLISLAMSGLTEVLTQNRREQARVAL